MIALPASYEGFHVANSRSVFGACELGGVVVMNQGL